MANKLPSREDLFSTFDSVDSAPDYSKAVGSLMLENQKTSSKLRRWSIFFLIILLLLAALAAAAFQSMYQNYRSNQTIAQIKEDPLGEVKVDSSDIAADSIEFDQLDSALQARIVNIDNSVTNLGGQVASTNESIENQPPDAGGTVTNVSTGAGLTGGPITGTGLIAVRAPTCTSNQRLSWDGANFRCVGVLGTGTVGPNEFFAGPTSGSGSPSYRAIVAGDLSGAISSTGPITYNDTTGDISCPTCITSVGTAFVASADSGSDQPLNIGDTLSLLGGDGISTVASTGNEVTFNLTDTGITPATYGSASSVPTFTVDSKGRLTSASSTAIAINASAITSGTLSVTRGGTGVNGSSASNGQLLIGNGSGYSLSTLTGAGPVGITNSAGGISIDCSTCVTTSGNGNITSSGGDITLGGTTTGRLIGSGNVNYDLSTTGVVGATYGSANQVATFTVDSKGRLTGASSTTISGLTSSNLSGAAAITNAQLQNSALTISSGNGLSGGGSISLGGSSSLAISAPTCLSNERLSWNGSAFICSTVAAGGSEAANTFFAGPTSGGAAAPAFRGIVTADLGSGTANNQSFLRGDQTWFQLLDGGGKIDSSLLPSNGLNLQGSWNANTNSPTLSDGGTGGVQGDFYIVNTSGTTSVDGTSTWNIGDWILHNGTTWERISNTNAVSSVNGNTGAVVLDTDDVSEGAGNLYFTNARARGAISGTGPISYNSGSGVIDCPTCVTTSGNGNIVAGTGASISGTLTGRLIGAGNVTFGVSSDVPTSVVNDTNVTGSISANALTLGWAGQLSASRGGTGVNGSGATNGQLLIGNGSGYSLSTLTGAGPVGITNSAGGISIDCSTCVTTSGNGNITSSGGDITLGGTTTGRLIGSGNVNYDLSTTGVVGATYGSANQVATFTVDSKGRLTGASSTSIAINASAITAGTLSVTRGGTGVDGSGATNGQLLIGNGSGYSLATLSSSGPIGITNSAGGISVGCSTCVTTGTTLFTAAGDLGVNQSVTSGQTVTFVGGVGLTTTGSATRNITVDLDNTAVAAATYGSASSVASFTVDAQGRITNASNTAIALNASAITAGTLSVTRGGTGVDGSGATNGQLLIGNGSGYSLATLSAGSGISVTNSAGGISIANTGAAATCGATTSYVCNNGNTLGAALNIGTTDSNILTLGTGSTTRFTVSSGAATLTGNGATTLTSSGAMTLNSASATALGIDSGTTGAINIGTGANSKTITIGNTTGTTGVNIDSGSGNINFRPGGSGTTANVQIGAGGAGSTTPDLLVLDRKSDAGDPTGTNGAMYYNSSTNKFRCFENSAWPTALLYRAVQATRNLSPS